MSRHLKLFGVLAITIIFIIQATTALKCWECSYDPEGNGEDTGVGIEGCGKSLDANKIGNGYLRECTFPNAVCYREELSENGVLRACRNERNINCNMNPCSTCKSDGCNGASQYGPIISLISIPVATVLLFKRFYV